MMNEARGKAHRPPVSSLGFLLLAAFIPLWADVAPRPLEGNYSAGRRRRGGRD